MRRKPIQTDDYMLLPTKRAKTKSGKLSLRLRQYDKVDLKTGTPEDFYQNLGEDRFDHFHQLAEDRE